MAVERSEIGYLPGRALIRLLWWLRRRIAVGPRRRHSLYREITRERGRLRQIERGLPPLATKPIRDRAGWTLRWDVFERSLAEASSLDVSSGAEICTGINLYHDADAPQLCWAQETRAQASYGLRITAYRFDGGFLSLAIAIPRSRSAMIRRGHELVVNLVARASRPLALHVRLNLSVEHRTEELHAHRILADAPQEVVFDLGGLGLDYEAGVTMWFDLIFSEPAMAEITFDELALTLRPRASAA
ncbi:MAG: DUF6478 family protein [Pseudomonadota bacterium]